MLLAIYVIIKKTISPRKSEEHFMIKFCQKQSFAVCSKKICKFLWKTPVLESLFLIKFKRLQHRYFPKRFCKFLRIFFFTEHFWWLLLEGFCEGTRLVKILHFYHFNISGINHRCFRKMPVKKNNE